MLAKEEPHDATGWSSVLLSPVSGTAIPMAEAPDPLFSSLALGDGAVILPTGGAICAPASGVVSMLAETKHAVLLDTDDGIEVLIHIGVDTVELGGTPFLAHVKQYDRVEAGQLLIEADLGLEIRDLSRNLQHLAGAETVVFDAVPRLEGGHRIRHEGRVDDRRLGRGCR